MNNNRGLTAIELMVAVGVVAITIVIIFFPQIEIQKRMIEGEKKAARLIQINDLKQKVVFSETSLTTSSLIAPDNNNLCPCTQGGSFIKNGNKVCTLSLCQANQEQDFSFFDPKSNPPLLISGTSAKPVYYTTTGATCTPGNSDPEKVCAYKATTKFKAHCPGDLTTCDHADYLIVTLELIPTTSNSTISYEKTQILYPVPLNYNPKITAIANQTLQTAEKKKIPVVGDPGDPTESQNYIFIKCESSAPDVLEVKCYKFINSVAQIIMTGKDPGTAKVTLQIDDGGAENSESAPVTFDVTVTL